MALYTTPLQLKTIYTLLNRNHLRDEKENIVKYFTNNRTEHVNEMYGKEASALIHHLGAHDAKGQAARRMRNKILSLAHAMNWRVASTTHVDMDRVNNWCIKHGYLHKKLDAHSYAELPKLVSQFEMVYKGFLKAI